jgi:7-cyano-7-deazaguanine synthase
MSSRPTVATGHLTIPDGLAPDTSFVVLAGGGVETAVLLPALLALGYAVQPLHVRCGFTWEADESACLGRLAAVCANPRLMPVIEIGYPLGDVLADHWGMRGRDVPSAGSPPAGLEIPFRNITLLTAAAIRFRASDPLVLATGTTADNHFGDGSRAFFDACERLLATASGRRVTIATPFIGMSKPEVIRRGSQEALACSWSCVDPRGGRHCGRCIKCGRRREAFRLAATPDPTDYASPARE